MRAKGNVNCSTLVDDFSPVIDAHAHLGITWPEEHVVASAAEGIRMMDSCGIEKACSSASRYLRFDFREGNRLTLKVREEFPDRVIGFCIAESVARGV